MAETESRSLAVHYPWQQEAWQKLCGLQAQQRLPHALLLSGSRGIGKLRFAKALAQRLLCEQPQDDVACGQCRQCQLNLSGLHPDIKYLQPEEGKRQIRVDDVREVVGFLSKTAQQGGYKVAIIQPAEAMNSSAANALLKVLEEPAGQSLLILVTDRPGSLLPTVRSRCQLVAMATPSQQVAMAWLQTILPSDQPLQALLDAANGQPLTAQALHADGSLELLAARDRSFSQLLAGKLSPLKLAEQWQETDIEAVLSWLQHKLMTLIKKAMTGQGGGRVRRLYSLLDRINELLAQVQRGNNPNKQLLLEDLLIQCSKLS
jgi:DNA polymerase-3 subunit delta'